MDPNSTKGMVLKSNWPGGLSNTENANQVAVDGEVGQSENSEAQTTDREREEASSGGGEPGATAALIPGATPDDRPGGRAALRMIGDLATVALPGDLGQRPAADDVLARLSPKQVAGWYSRLAAAT